MRISTFVILASVGVLAIAAALSTIPAPRPAAPVASATLTISERISDDDPRFSCRTMGNRVCGIDGYQGYGIQGRLA